LESYIGSLLLVPYNFAPVGWALCQGQSLPISQYDALFALIGTTYGGDGQTTFNLPDLRGRSTIGAGQGPSLQSYVLGQTGGTETVTLTPNQIGHGHSAGCSQAANNSANPKGGIFAAGNAAYVVSDGNTALAPSTLTPAAGGSQPHDNRQPYNTLNWIICLEGIFPPRS
jgi:microcystin-dependent protein